ncbi:MAG: hypothetical protein U0L12_07355 [Ruminococcus sp.]|nr:hypothetical protein [Ruminococcus sp.]
MFLFSLHTKYVDASVMNDVSDKVEEWQAPQIALFSEEQNENGLFHDDVAIHIEVTEKGQPCSGIHKITYKIYALDIGAIETGTLFDRDSDHNKGAIFSSDRLAYLWKGTLTIDADIFNSNHVQVEIIAVDSAGNQSVSKTKDEEIAIDKTAPVIQISYDNNSSVNGKYFTEGRTAMITIMERNFNAEDVVLKTYSKYGNVPKKTTWTKISGNGNQDNTIWKMMLYYGEEDEYSFDITYKDSAGNACSGILYGNSEASNSFVIDKTSPTVTVQYDNNDVKNEKYFDKTRTATVRVKERNFAEDKVLVAQTAFVNDVKIANPEITWVHNGDTHTATIIYEKDGSYTLDIHVQDMTDHVNKTVDYGNSAAGKAFVIDQAIDVLEIRGVEDGKTYNGEVLPVITYKDANYDSVEMKLVHTKLEGNNVNITKKLECLIEKNEQGGMGTCDIFAKDVKWDGLYELSLAIKDKAGNKKAESIVFTINRFGSQYAYSDSLAALLCEDRKYVKTSMQDLLLTEYNASPLIENSMHVEITRDGKPLDDNIYSVSMEKKGWYEYQYTIAKENFIEEGFYKVSVFSEDEAGHKSENSSEKETEISFVIDDTPPEITSITGLEKKIVDAQNVEVTYTVFDTVGLKNVKIYLNGKQYGDTITDFGENANDYKGYFQVEESQGFQTIQLVVEDLAGNITDTNDEDFKSAYDFQKSVLVSSQLYVKNMVKRGIWVVSILCCGMLGLYIYKKKPLKG